MGGGTGSNSAITPTNNAIDAHGKAGETEMGHQLARTGKRGAARRWTVALYAIFAALCTASANAQDLSELPFQLQEKVEIARQACSDFENGQFALEFGAVRRVDLDGDIHRGWVLDESGFACSTAVSLYCGTGGCMSHSWSRNICSRFSIKDGTRRTSDRSACFWQMCMARSVTGSTQRPA